MKKEVFKNFAKFTGKQLCQILPSTLLKKRLWHKCFPVNFAKFLRTPFYRTPPVAASLYWKPVYFLQKFDNHVTRIFAAASFT